MRKFLLLCLMAIGFCSASVAQLNLVPDVELGVLSDGDIVAIWDKTANKFLYGSYNQNLGYGLAEDAFGTCVNDGNTVPTNGWLFKVEEAEGHLLFLLQKRDGGDYGVWGSPGYLNSQPNGGVSFILGITGKNNETGEEYEYGQDGNYLALWDLEPAEGGGFYLKNVGTDNYLKGNSAASFSMEEATVWTFCTLADNSPLKSDKVKLLESWIVNGDFEGDDLSSFPFSYDGPNNKTEEHPEGTAVDPLPIANEGPDGSKCAKITSFDEPTESWHTQLYLRTNEEIPNGTAFLLKMSVKADEDDIKITTSGQAEPRTWKGGSGLSEDIYVGTEWQELSFTGKISCDQFHSMALDLNNGDEEVTNTSGEGTANVNRAVTFWFDNIEFGTYEKACDLQHNQEAIRVLFPEYTNLPDMINAIGKTRIMYPIECVTVTVDGEVVPVGSVEADRKGQFMIFLDEDWIMEHGDLTEDSEVKVKFTNPAGDKNITYLDDDKTPASDFEDELSVYNEDLDIESFAWTNPELLSSDPENGSFCIPANITEFKVTFDKKVRSQMLVAKLDGTETLTVTPQDAAAEITLTRTGSGDLAEGEHTISITKVYTWSNYPIPEGTQDSPVSLVFSVGEAAMSEELLAAIQSAQTVYDEATEDEAQRYVGTATATLSETIAKYEGEGATYTAPSQVRAAVKDLQAKSKTVTDHVALCDSYDTNLGAAEQIVGENASTKFANHNAYKALAEVVAQYSGKDPLTDDELLTPAVAVLSENVTMAGYLFTEGESGLGDCGVKVLTEALRSGAETLMALGASEDDEAVVAAQNALTDDEELTEIVKNNVKLRLYEALKDEATAADLFVSEEPDEDSGEMLPAKYDMSVFIKNPNIYSLNQGDGSKAGNVPGWTAPEGLGLYCRAWGGGDRGIANLPQDCAFSNWCANQRMEQTIEDLPVGVYTVVVYGEDWLNACAEDRSESFAFYRLSSTLTPDEEDDDTDEIYYEGTMILGHSGSVQGVACEFEDVEITDGRLDLGIQFKRGTGTTQYMFDRVKLYLTGAVPGYNYADEYEQIKTGVNTAKTAKVRAIEVYDLNGRRIQKAQKGLNIVKRVMSDGSVKTDKVVK